MIKLIEKTIFLILIVTQTAFAPDPHWHQDTESDEFQYGDLDVSERPLPPDLMQNETAKILTPYEQEMEECMIDYAACIATGVIKTGKVCAEHEMIGRKTFDNICHMIYESCKGDGLPWHYIHNGLCNE